MQQRLHQLGHAVHDGHVQSGAAFAVRFCLFAERCVDGCRRDQRMRQQRQRHLLTAMIMRLSSRRTQKDRALELSRTGSRNSQQCEEETKRKNETHTLSRRFRHSAVRRGSCKMASETYFIASRLHAIDSASVKPRQTQSQKDHKTKNHTGKVKPTTKEKAKKGRHVTDLVDLVAGSVSPFCIIVVPVYISFQIESNPIQIQE